MKLFRCFRRKKNKKVEEIASNDAPAKTKQMEELPQPASVESAEPEHYSPRKRLGSMEEAPPPPHHHEEISDVRTNNSDGRRKVVPLANSSAPSMISHSGTVDSYYSKGTASYSKGSTTAPSATRGLRANRPPVPPPAREAAFHGPPRFDWIDIETTAAIKIQSVVRRMCVMNRMERRGLSTSAIRNRKRRRKAAKKSLRSRAVQSGDVPSFFNCCAVGLAFGDATEEDDDAYRQFQKAQYEERQRQQAMHEDALRMQYMKKNGLDTKLFEAVEIVD